TLDHYEPATESSEGVKLIALIFGGRDYSTMPNIVMAHDCMNSVNSLDILMN
ncbi:MAG: phosphoenolpyruvate carboxykinase (GTP), partial [Candidatus Electrothrix sp. AX5]|nr:phosphoenolpyruvate carboxykinase (GTP) [Candidatus Electrothrix sp. AX5]